MSTTWHNHNTGPTAQKDGYIALGGSSELGSANDFGTMIIDPDKRLVAVGLILNNVDRIDESVPVNYVNSNFVFIYNSPMDSDNEYITVNEMHSIIEKINHHINDQYIFGNEYFMRSNI
ncbi:hypothetical protein AA102526_2842 [Asaia lannensis NBRC 102526]|nr:hypothetical protein AA102526_2842 [Asaia lannensis NBRC 102526]